MPMRTDELDYVLPPGRIATVPAQPRDSAKMLVVHADRIEHRCVSNLPEYLNPGDAMVFNNSAVLPARITGSRAETGGRVQGLVLDAFISHSPMIWQLMLKSNGRLRPGIKIRLELNDGRPSPFSLTLLEKVDREWTAEISIESDIQKSLPDAAAILNQVGRTPLPPYILQSRQDDREDIEDAEDRAWYQTVYADIQQQRSVAAPTAGLHFTERLLAKLNDSNIKQHFITLHVSAGTFQPIDTELLDDHPMHREAFSVTQQTLEQLRSIRKTGNRLFAVGTTTVRCLESINPADIDTMTTDSAIHASTDLLISPPYTFKWTDGLLTNFHLPRSTLFALVGAKIGLDRLKHIYQIALAEDYRFYSYGDAMLILP